MPIRKKTKTSKLDTVTDHVIDALNNTDIDEKEKFEYRLTQLERLDKLTARNEPQRVSPDTWATIGANLSGIVIVMHYERAHVIVTKAWGLVRALR